MDNSLSREATDWREGRRLRAFELKQQGWSQQRIAEALGVSKGAVSQWMKRAREGGGIEALKRQPAPGARPRLSEEQRKALAKPETVTRLNALGANIIGDTPADVSCGACIDARAVAVATGAYSVADLMACAPHAAFENLCDTDRVLEAIFAPRVD